MFQDLAGNWALKIVAGVITLDGMTQTVPADRIPLQRATMTAVDGGLGPDPGRDARAAPAPERCAEPLSPGRSQNGQNTGMKITLSTQKIRLSGTPTLTKSPNL